MATQNVSRADIYPDGTSVGAYPKSQWTTSQLPPSGAPPGSPTSSATVTSGVAALTGLADATNYYAGGQVGGVWRYLSFRTPNAAASSGGGGSGLPSNPVVKTAGYTAAANDLVLADATGGTVPIALPALPAVGALVTVIKTDASANPVTVTGTVDGDAGGVSIDAQFFGGVYEHVGSDAWRTMSVTAAASAGIVLSSTKTADYTYALADLGTVVNMNAAGATALAVPPHSVVAFPVGAILGGRRMGAGAVTLTPGAGVTIPNRVQIAGTANRTIATQGSEVSFRQDAIDSWSLVGDIA